MPTQRSPYIQRMINLEPEDYLAVKNFADEKGLGRKGFSAAIRIIIREWSLLRRPIPHFQFLAELLKAEGSHLDSQIVSTADTQPFYRLTITQSRDKNPENETDSKDEPPGNSAKNYSDPSAPAFVHPPFP